MKKVHLVFLAVLSLSIISCTSPAIQTYDLTCDYLSEPLGIDNVNPNFGWKIKGTPQAAYRIIVSSEKKANENNTLWDSGEVQSTDQFMVKYEGEQLSSRDLCWWKVMVWDKDGNASNWSEPQRFSVGVLSPDSVNGEYIGATPGEGRSALVWKRFNLSSKTNPVLLHVNSLGYHEVYINGKKVGEAVLSPAVSQLDKRSLIMTYDVTDLVRRGENDIVIWTGSGWYKPFPFEAIYEGALVKAEISVQKSRGIWNCITSTDSSWKGCFSGYSDTGRWGAWGFGGEIIDAAVVPADLSARSLEQMAWDNVDVVPANNMEATPMMCQPCQIVETIAAVSIEPHGENCYLVDFGRAMNAMIDIQLPQMPAGHEVVASYSDDSSLDEITSDIFICSGKAEGDHFCNKFNHHVFRYVTLKNMETAPELSGIKAHRMRTAFADATTFKCSDEEINQIHDMIKYTMENLAFDGYMVDCANIERLGYGGDGNASALSLQTMFDVAPLYNNWLMAWNDAIDPDGSVPHTAPCPYGAGGGPYWCSFIVQAPWRTYMSYGDTRTIESTYENMKKWIGYVDRYSTAEGLLKQWPDVHNRGWWLGDWAAPDGVNVMDDDSRLLVNNCALSQSYADLVKMARMLGNEADAQEFEQRLDRTNKLIHKKFFHKEDNTYASKSQLDLVYPLLVGAVPADLVDAVVASLKERTATVYNGHLSTGLVGVPVITEWATQNEEADFIYGMLKQHGYPGYLYMIDNGATSTWEIWNGERSRLHNCYNGIGSWFYQAVGGIIPVDPGYKSVIIAPQAPSGMDWAEVTKETPYGTIKVRWDRLEDGFIDTRVTLPPGIKFAKIDW